MSWRWSSNLGFNWDAKGSADCAGIRRGFRVPVSFLKSYTMHRVGVRADEELQTEDWRCRPNRPTRSKLCSFTAKPLASSGGRIRDRT
jgi:hypothetical protein